MALDLRFRMLRGSVELQGLMAHSVSITDLKKMLHQKHSEGPLAVPEPQLQRLVHKGRVLRDGAATLADAGLSHGDVLVLLFTRQLPPPPAPLTTPAPDGISVRAALLDEARLRGLDPAALTDRLGPTRARRGGAVALNLPAELLNMDPRMLQLLQQALDGSGLLAGLGEQLAAQGVPQQGETGVEYEEEDVVPPEPPAGAITQLTDMGFGPEVSRKAMLLSRNSVELALEWLLQHGDDPGAGEPPTREQLRAVWGTRRRRRRAVVAAPGAAASVLVRGPAAAAPAAGQPHQQQPQQEQQQQQPQPQQQQQQQQQQLQPAAPLQPQQQVPPPQQPRVRPQPVWREVDEEAVAQMVDMGFQENVARRTLSRYGDVSTAISYLLSVQEGAGEAVQADAGAAAASGGADEATQREREQQLGQQAGPSGLDHGQDAHQQQEQQPQQAAALQQRPGAAVRDEAMASPQVSRGDAGGDMPMAEAVSPVRSTAARAEDHQQQQQQQQQQEPGEGGNEAEMMDADAAYGMASDEFEDGVEWVEEGGSGDEEDGEDEEEFLDPDGGEAMQQLGNALGTLGSMDLAQLNSTDMEQLLQGIDLEELMGSQLFPGAVEPGNLGTNAHDVLLRIMESPGLLQQALGGGGGGGGSIAGGAQQQQAQQQQAQQQQAQQAQQQQQGQDQGQQPQA